MMGNFWLDCKEERELKAVTFYVNMERSKSVRPKMGHFKDRFYCVITLENDNINNLQVYIHNGVTDEVIHSINSETGDQAYSDSGLIYSRIDYKNGWIWLFWNDSCPSSVYAESRYVYTKECVWQPMSGKVFVK